MEGGSVEEVGIGNAVDVFAEVGVATNPMGNGFGEANGGRRSGAEVGGNGDVVGRVLWVEDGAIGVCRCGEGCPHHGGCLRRYGRGGR